ncbi:MAG: ribosome biogenesis GTPase Der [Dehalococcoidia bacterium]|nr:ribosome biogenesis GTPase Der [Dehalococcoidia bacterium]
MTSYAPLVAIIGRPNVGKSALFNRLTRSRNALVEDFPGTTRDRIYGEVEWGGRHLRVVDTGGLEGPDSDPLTPLVHAQVVEALAEADAILFLVDGSEPLTAADRDVADLLRRSAAPVLLVANKADRKATAANLVELFELGLGEAMSISAYHGAGIGDLLDRLLEIVPGAEAPPATERLSIAIVGRPNVGKSSLVNAILGEQRAIVSELPGTTRDAIDSPLAFEGHALTLVDTAGIRRRGSVQPGVERHAVSRAERAIDRADVVFLVIDAADPMVAQDTHIAGYVDERTKGMVLVVNKWDLAGDRDRHAFARRIDLRYRFTPWAPVLFTCALTGEGVRELLELAVHIGEVRRRRAQTSELNLVMHRAFVEHAPPTVGRSRLKLLYATQAEVAPPTFVFFVNDPELLHFSYRRYLENRLREAFGFEGTAIRMVFRRRSEDRHEAPP